MSRTKAYSTSDLLINEPKYSWLRDLGLQAENPGVFDGAWHGSGTVSASQSVAAGSNRGATETTAAVIIIRIHALMHRTGALG